MKIISKCFTTNFFGVNEATAQIRDSEETEGCEELTRCRKEPHQNQNTVGMRTAVGSTAGWREEQAEEGQGGDERALTGPPGV